MPDSSLAREKNARIKAFMEAILIPDKDFEAIVQVQGISIPHPALLGDVELIRASPSLLQDWDRWSGPLRPPWRGQTVARMTVSGGTINAARRYALDRTSMICDELRIAFPSIIRARISDDQVVFGPGWNALRGNGSTLYQLDHRRRRPFGWDEIFDAAIEFLAPLYALRNTGRTRIQRRVDLAVRWLGMSWNAGTPWAMKMIALFAGLEALLIKGEREPKKGALLSLRNALLAIAVEGQFPNPAVALSLYYDRSELVHGSRTTADEQDYQGAFGLASQALRNYVSIANENPEVRSHGKLLDLVADVQTLVDLRGWIEGNRPWGYEELLEELDKLAEGAAGSATGH